jgi:hypothetical protein
MRVGRGQKGEAWSGLPARMKWSGGPFQMPNARAHLRGPGNAGTGMNPRRIPLFKTV